jgi:hypothetical protein
VKTFIKNAGANKFSAPAKLFSAHCKKGFILSSVNVDGS